MNDDRKLLNARCSQQKHKKNEPAKKTIDEEKTNPSSSLNYKAIAHAKQLESKTTKEINISDNIQDNIQHSYIVESKILQNQEKILENQINLFKRIDNFEEGIKKSLIGVLTQINIFKEQQSKNKQFTIIAELPIKSINGFNIVETKLEDEQYRKDLVCNVL